jgi:hypothetical protein
MERRSQIDSLNESLTLLKDSKCLDLQNPLLITVARTAEELVMRLVRSWSLQPEAS